MNLVIDESVDSAISERLRQNGHEVLCVAEMAPGITDEQVLNMANERNALLVTADKDFGELVYRLFRVNGGVLLIRLAGLSLENKARIVAAAVRDYGSQLPGAFAVISPGAIRVRKRS